MLRLSNRRLANTLCHSIKSRWASTKSNNVAYEEALKLIALDKKERLEMLSRVEKEVARVTKDSSSPTQTAQLAALNALKFDLQVKAELNDPEIRQNFDNKNNIDMSRPVYRYLTERQFQNLPRKKLLERITQMNVMPDVVDLDVNPTVDVKLQFVNHDDIVEPGVYTVPEQSITLPKIEITNFHTETKLYTLLLVDPDSPDVVNKTYQQYCHWLITNVPLSATESIVKGGNTVLDYVPPHPQKGTKAHRYTIIAYEQSKELKQVDSINRDHFDVKSFAKQHDLNVRGITFFRQKWDESVSKIYNEILKTKEPIYGKPPKQEPYIQRTMYI
ncbi:phosphatidylethanolamine-binding protein [Cunninghamella echinulata]|nr:phosphatidylethanolamine-binding protein [Cunninghamella echinulata]